MKRRSFRSPFRRVWGPATVYQTTLAPSSVLTGVKSDPCRVCGEPILIGDACFGRAWHIGFAHLACGWYTPADVHDDARDAMHRIARGEGITKEQSELLVRGGWAKPSTGEVEWTERGALVYRQFVEIVATVMKEVA